MSPLAVQEKHPHVQVLDQAAQPGFALTKGDLAPLLLLERGGEGARVALEGAPHQKDGEQAGRDEQEKEIVHLLCKVRPPSPGGQGTAALDPEGPRALPSHSDESAPSASHPASRGPGPAGRSPCSSWREPSSTPTTAAPSSAIAWLVASPSTQPTATAPPPRAVPRSAPPKTFAAPRRTRGLGPGRRPGHPRPSRRPEPTPASRSVKGRASPLLEGRGTVFRQRSRHVEVTFRRSYAFCLSSLGLPLLAHAPPSPRPALDRYAGVWSGRTERAWPRSSFTCATTSRGSAPTPPPRPTARSRSSTCPSTPTSCTRRPRASSRCTRAWTSATRFPARSRSPCRWSTATEAITVSAEATAAQLEVDSSTSHVDIDKSYIARAPASMATRAMEELITATPGFAKDENGRYHFQGSHSQGQFVVDGQTISDQTGVTFSNSIDPGIAQSIEVIYGNIPAEFGDKVGAVVNMSTKSGLSNPLKAEVYGGVARFSTHEGGLNLGGGSRTFGVFASVTGSRSDRFLDPVNFDNLHNDGDTERGFLRLDYASPDLDEPRALHGPPGTDPARRHEHLRAGSGRPGPVREEPRPELQPRLHPRPLRQGHLRRERLWPPGQLRALLLSWRHPGNRPLRSVDRQLRLRPRLQLQLGPPRGEGGRRCTSAYPIHEISSSASPIPASTTPRARNTTPTSHPTT